MPFQIQTDETEYRIVSPEGDASETAEYGDPAILVCTGGIYYALCGADDESPKVFRVTAKEAVDTEVEEVSFENEDEGDDSEEEDEEEEEGVVN